MGHVTKLHPVPATTDVLPAQNFDDLSFSIDGLPLVPAGVYDVVCLGCRKCEKFNRTVLLFTFQIASQGQWLGTVLPTYINYPVGKGHKGRCLPPKSKLAQWLRIIQAYDLAEMNPARINLSVFSKYQFEAMVETVTTSHDKIRVLREHEFSSKIAEIRSIVGRVSA